jgi:hypothetical protein
MYVDNYCYRPPGMFRNLWWILHFAAEFDACVNKFSCYYWYEWSNVISIVEENTIVMARQKQICSVLCEHLATITNFGFILAWWNSLKCKICIETYTCSSKGLLYMWSGSGSRGPGVGYWQTIRCYRGFYSLVWCQHFAISMAVTMI